jgi:carboxyl-terminal processing protease
MGGFQIGLYLTKKQQRHAGNKIDTILEIIDRQYVDTVNINQLIERTARNLVKELDPHSVLISASDMEIVGTDLEGSFSGIGVMFNTPSDTILVISVISGGPAEKAGVMPFDRIIMINDSVFAGKGMSQMQIMRTLRGEKNSKVKLGIMRGDASGLLDVTVTRGDVPNYSVDASFSMDGGIGYIKIDKFARTTYNEFITALARLKKEECGSFIIDLRGNSGGYLEAAIRMVNEFIAGGSPIVYTEGKAYRRQDFMADGSGTCQNDPLVVLVDELSVSSSEIFAGAIQDNDRGMIIGRRTYGKGLVQAPVPLSDGSELRLTVGRYYTPSGRCIQKTYELGHSVEYEQDIDNRFLHGEFDSADSIKLDESLVYSTLGGRTVYGGGGIMPDIFVPRDTSQVTSYYSRVVNSGALYQFTLDYSDRNHARLNEFKSYEALLAYLKQQPLLSEFTDYAETKGIPKRAVLIRTSRSLIETSLYAYIVRNFFDRTGFYPIVLKDDVTLRRAVQEIRNGNWSPKVP